MQILNSISFNPSDMTRFACRQQKCAKNHEIDDLYCSGLCRKLWQRPCKEVRLRTCWPKAEKPLRWTQTEASKAGFLVVKSGIKSNRQYTLLHLQAISKLYFEIAFLYHCINCIFLIFLLKDLLINSCTTEGAQVVQLCIFVYQLYLFRSFLYLFAKNTLFLIFTSCKVYLFTIIVLSLKSTEMSAEKVT